MDITSNINSVPASNSNLRRGFWQSRLDASPVYIEESSTSFNVYQDGSSHNRVYTDGDNDEMMPDAALSGSDGKGQVLCHFVFICSYLSSIFVGGSRFYSR